MAPDRRKQTKFVALAIVTGRGVSGSSNRQFAFLVDRVCLNCVDVGLNLESINVKSAKTMVSLLLWLNLGSHIPNTNVPPIIVLRI